MISKMVSPTVRYRHLSNYSEVFDERNMYLASRRCSAHSLLLGEIRSLRGKYPMKLVQFRCRSLKSDIERTWENRLMMRPTGVVMKCDGAAPKSPLTSTRWMFSPAWLFSLLVRLTTDNRFLRLTQL